MTNHHGTPIWYELMTDAPDPAQDFYGAIMGWSFTKPPGGLERDYRVFRADGEDVGGVMKAPDGACFAPAWAAYFGVSDVDAAAEKVKALGGTVHMEPQDIPGVGRFAFVADPQGAVFYLMRGDSDGNSTAFEPRRAGHCSWNELVTSDQDAALEFYGKLFGWERAGSVTLSGDMGEYVFIKNGDADLGAMMDAPTNAGSFWNFAFWVTDIDAAKSTVENGGGLVRMGPTEKPSGEWVLQATDPQGAKVMFMGQRM
ncbi:VOC family protein [Inquilinus sp. CAU 1745]|uniref:VOC family protein n=1 Tax=Inquilinus sp. CAU 1745 TaxID=3140369 RepID=UPI00325A7AA8